MDVAQVTVYLCLFRHFGVFVLLRHYVFDVACCPCALLQKSFLLSGSFR